jgi:NADH:ubiquinone oxidoreductase subunit E
MRGAHVNQKKPWREFEPRRENILKMLHAAQRTLDATSHIDDEELADIAEYLGMSLAEVSGVLSFYQAFSRRPRGRHVIRLCDSLSCRISGSLEVYQAFRHQLGVGRGETTRDGEFTLEIVNCLGSCDTAPNVMIDDRLFTHVKPSDVESILEEVRTNTEVPA